MSDAHGSTILARAGLTAANETKAVAALPRRNALLLIIALLAAGLEGGLLIF